ncbi:MAG TPA: alpha/beta fold hydrolase [Dehalococcoidia bacterium]|nr:alpha/beta fold hydrolase [Dehalococcoidia bacterium]
MQVYTNTQSAEPFFFRTSGSPNKPLFGCFHPPQGETVRESGIVLCYPLGREYIRSHRAYRQLAMHLSNAGFPVLRFDFYGCGDSGGERGEGQISQWLDDISAAVEEVRGRCNGDRVCLVGLRFGGALAMLAGARRGDVANLVLWNPVVSGREYIQEISELPLQRKRRKGMSTAAPSSNDGGQFTEIGGFPFANTFLSDLRNLNLLEVEKPPARNVFLIDSNQKSGYQELRQRLGLLTAQVEYQHIPSLEVWTRASTALVPAKVVEAAVSWISGVSQ